MADNIFPKDLCFSSGKTAENTRILEENPAMMKLSTLKNFKNKNLITE